MLAYGKINLTLEILARRDDGYHGLRSVMLPIGLADDISIVPAAAFAFTCEPAELTSDNLVMRALERIGCAGAGVAVTLRKHIPVGAGLGGGSSDAGAILRAAMAGAFGAVPARDWLADARALGSDVPFFLIDGGALVEGTGERVTAAGALPPWWIVLLVPDVHVATPAAFARLAQSRRSEPQMTRARSESCSLRALIALQRGDYASAVSAAHNDFEPLIAAMFPEVAAALAALRATGAGHAMLSGSGGACFSLCRDETTAREIAARLAPMPAASLHVVPFAPTASWRTPAPV